MGKALRRLVAVGAIVLVVSGCRPPWHTQMDMAVPCTASRAPVTDTIGPGDLSIGNGYARAQFEASTFTRPTVVTMRPYSGLHGFHLDFPSEEVSPPFTAYFYLDYCNVTDRTGLRIATKERVAPAMVGRDTARAETPRQAAEPQEAAWRRIERGELDDEYRGAGFVAPRLPLRGGWVILSN